MYAFAVELTLTIASDAEKKSPTEGMYDTHLVIEGQKIGTTPFCEDGRAVHLGGV